MNKKQLEPILQIVKPCLQRFLQKAPTEQARSFRTIFLVLPLYKLKVQ